MVDQHGFSDAEWELLLAVPFAVFFLVAYADGTLSSAERRAFASIAAEVSARADRPQDALVGEVMGQISRDFDQIMGRLDLQMGDGVPWVLSAGRNLLDAMSEGAAALAFKDTMISMAQTVAEAWPRFGRRTTTEEQRSIDFVRDLLGVPSAP
ncbi:MAG TPA: hypothetical protein VES01_02620 [Dermatophilaceae bacterium]|nr:hypothetical protein [Dermatophilaceae bacterium]